MKKTKIIQIMLVQADHDTELDGVPNRKDCQPLDHSSQDNIIKTLSHVKERMRLGDTVSIGTYGEEVGKVTEIKGDLVKVDFGLYSQWVSLNVLKKYRFG